MVAGVISVIGAHAPFHVEVESIPEHAYAIALAPSLVEMTVQLMDQVILKLIPAMKILVQVS